jgi:hypothetical protein
MLNIIPEFKRIVKSGFGTPERVISTESIQMGTQSYTEKAQRATKKNSVKLCVSSVLSVFLKNSAFVRVTRSGFGVVALRLSNAALNTWFSQRTLR